MSCPLDGVVNPLVANENAISHTESNDDQKRVEHVCDVDTETDGYIEVDNEIQTHEKRRDPQNGDRTQNDNFEESTVPLGNFGNEVTESTNSPSVGIELEELVFDDKSNNEVGDENKNAVERDAYKQILLEQKKNAQLLCWLSDFRSSNSDQGRVINQSSQNQSDDQLERTYKKTLSDYNEAFEQLERQTALYSKHSTKLRNRLLEKDAKAKSLTQTLQEDVKEIAQQSSFANNKSFDMDRFEELKLKSDRLDDHVERERMKNISLKVDISQLSKKITEKKQLAGGISHMEFHRLENDIKKSDDKLKCYDNDLKRNTSNKQHLLNMESKLHKEIQICREINEKTEPMIKELDDKNEKKRIYLSRLESAAKITKKKIGYDASEIGALLKSQMINEDFACSKDELERLRKKLNELKAYYATLIHST
ncbi:hypothetical protein HJC23_007222 [Cyclotella cryptica]|uniref:Uncharacterized protein n=1 Tax=Cyclotella cryptica TaxID=29204 RepID=A0ABD3QQA2_9STRA